MYWSGKRTKEPPWGMGAISSFHLKAQTASNSSSPNFGLPDILKSEVQPSFFCRRVLVNTCLPDKFELSKISPASVFGFSRINPKAQNPILWLNKNHFRHAIKLWQCTPPYEPSNSVDGNSPEVSVSSTSTVLTRSFSGQRPCLEPSKKHWMVKGAAAMKKYATHYMSDCAQTQSNALLRECRYFVSESKLAMSLDRLCAACFIAFHSTHPCKTSTQEF